MKVNLGIIILSLLIIQVQLHLRAEKRQELMNQFARKIDETQNLDKIYEELYAAEDSFKKMNYDVSEIQKLLAQYNLPENYNYLQENKATIYIKDQASCGSCWSFASTSALAYRYLKYGEDLNLSPQNPLSCYFPDCEAGNYPIDAQLNLVKNGTVTEKCFPYQSSDGKTMPSCPNTCEDGSEYKRYYSQNAYVAYNSVQEKFYDFVLLVMDQIVNQGPVQAGFTVTEDFDKFGKDKTKCKNEVFSYDGVSKGRGGHAVILVGYGLLNNKFYWLMQNSWGPDWCDNGFIKMEIDQFNTISFSEPHIKPEQVTPAEIDLTLTDFDHDCSLLLKSSSLDKWKNTLEVTFTNSKTNQNFVYQVGRNKILGKNEINCNYEIYQAYSYLKKGQYVFKEGQSLGEENTFNINALKNQKFDFYGNDYIDPLYYFQYFVSQVGSKIIFIHEYIENDEILPPIYMVNEDEIDDLEKCGNIKTSTKLPVNLAYCEITQNDLAFLESKNASLDLYNQFLCTYITDTGMTLYKLDTKNYLAFNIIQFLMPNDTQLTPQTDLILVSSVAGSSKNHKNDENFFLILLEVENDNKNTTFYGYCGANYNSQSVQSNLTCHLNETNQAIPYENIYLLPYHLFMNVKTPFDVIIKYTLKAGDDIRPDPTPTGFSEYLGYSLGLLIFMILL